MCKGCITCIYCSSQLFIFHHNLKHRNYALSLNRNQFFFFLLKPVGLQNLQLRCQLLSNQTDVLEIKQSLGETIYSVKTQFQDFLSRLTYCRKCFYTVYGNFFAQHLFTIITRIQQKNLGSISGKFFGILSCCYHYILLDCFLINAPSLGISLSHLRHFLSLVEILRFSQNLTDSQHGRDLWWSPGLPHLPCRSAQGQLLPRTMCR